MIKHVSDLLIDRVNSYQKTLFEYLALNAIVIFSLAFIALCAYGFELFNFNLTIDEEVHATRIGPILGWITQGRWGMYLLNRFLLPYTVLPFVPLFLAILFQISAILLMLNAWDVQERSSQIMIGSIGLAFPVLAYMYTFSTINYGIGFGFFCLALSLFVFKKSVGAGRFAAMIPAAFSIAIYQGFIPALLSIFLIYVIAQWIKIGNIPRRLILEVFVVHAGAFGIYFAVHEILHFFITFPSSSYTSQYFGVSSLYNEFLPVLIKTWTTTKQVYLGDKSIYAIQPSSFPYLLAISLVGLGAKIFKSKASILDKAILVLLSLFLLLLPFSVGILLRGIVAMRFLVALPIVVSGLIFLGLGSNKFTDTAILLFAVSTIFQFTIITNHLFASSQLALQADRVLASQLIEKIESTKSELNVTDVKYLEVVGSLVRQPTVLIPKTETFGASFFEWDQGNTGRVILFLQTLGYDKLQAAPMDKRIEMIDVAETMPIWPAKGSVEIINDIVLLKLGPYSQTQKLQICEVAHNNDFCK